MSKEKLTPAEMRFCLYVHQGMTQGSAYMKAYPGFKGTVKTAGEEASRMKAKPKISARLEELDRMAAEAAHATESSVIQGLMKEARSAKTDGARVAAWQALAKILGINTKDRAVQELSDDEIEAELAGYVADKPAEEGDTLH